MNTQVPVDEEELRKQIILRSLLGNDTQSYGKPMIGNEQTANFANKIQSAGNTYFSGVPPQAPTQQSSSMLNYLRGQNILSQIKKRNEPSSGYFTFDENGNAKPVEGVDGMKPAPIGYSGLGQNLIKARTDASNSIVPLRKAQTESAQTGNRIMKDYIGTDNPNGASKNLPPGTTINAGPMNIPLNPALNDQQASAVSGTQSLDPIVERISKSLDSGIYDKGGGDIGRTFRQMASNTKMPLLTSLDPNLQSLQSDLNTLKKTIPFTEGGKQLTPFEAKQVFALLDTTGKNNPQIKNDLNQAMSIIRSKNRIALGGRNAAMQGSFNSPQEADNSGLPHGTKVTVNGRPYEIG